MHECVSLTREGLDCQSYRNNNVEHKCNCFSFNIYHLRSVGTRVRYIRNSGKHTHAYTISLCTHRLVVSFSYVLLVFKLF